MYHVPAAMYWVSHFLTGEWALVDFSPGAGSRLSIFCVLFGMMMFSIPTGIVAESVQNALALELVEHTGIDELDQIHRDAQDDDKGEESEAKPAASRRSTRKS